jgi:hypothetical protein
MEGRSRSSCVGTEVSSIRESERRETHLDRVDSLQAT